MSKWISVKDRFPENNSAVLVVTQNGSIYTCTRSVIKRKNERPDSGIYEVERFTHWQPLPIPPESE